MNVDSRYFFLLLFDLLYMIARGDDVDSLKPKLTVEAGTLSGAMAVKPMSKDYSRTIMPSTYTVICEPGYSIPCSTFSTPPRPRFSAILFVLPST